MIIVLNGPCGVGKTETSWKLLDATPPSAIVEGDDHLRVNPKDLASKHLARDVNNLMAQSVLYYLKNNADTVIVNSVWEYPEEMQEFKMLIHQDEEAIHVFRLTARDEVIEKRLRKRNTDLVWDLKRYKELQAVFESHDREHELGEVLDTSDMTAEQVRDHILVRCDLI